MNDSKNKNTEAANTQKASTSETNEQAGRRRLLKAGGVVASAALLPEKWQKPVVDNVVLPAHATMSAPLPLAGPVTFVSGAVIPTDPAVSMMAQTGKGVLDTIISPAYAVPVPSTPAPTPCPDEGDCVTVLPPNASNKVQFTYTTSGQNITGMLDMISPLGYKGYIGDHPVEGKFTDSTFTATEGTICNFPEGSFYAVRGGICTPPT